jgi:hypothetical protein
MVTAAASPAAHGSGEPTLTEVRRATERFQDVNAALAEGYIRDPFTPFNPAVSCEHHHGGGHDAAMHSMH